MAAVPPKPGGKQRYSTQPKRLASFQCIFTKPNYFAVEAETSKRHSQSLATRSSVIRRALDLGFKVYNPSRLTFRGSLRKEHRFVASRVILRADLIEQIRKLARRGYTQDLIFNKALEKGLEELKQLQAVAKGSGQKWYMRGKPPSSDSTPSE